MTQEKLKRVIVAFSVAGTLLLTILFAVIVGQIIAICVKNDRLQKLETEIAQLEQQKEEDLELADYLESDIGQFWLAVQKNFLQSQGENK